MSSIFSSNPIRSSFSQRLNCQQLGQFSPSCQSSQIFQPLVFGQESDGKEPVKRYKGNTPHMFDLVVTGLFGALSGVGFLISAANPFIGVPLLAVGGFGAVRQVMTNFVYRAVKAGMA